MLLPAQSLGPLMHAWLHLQGSHAHTAPGESAWTHDHGGPGHEAGHHHALRLLGQCDSVADASPSLATEPRHGFAEAVPPTFDRFFELNDPPHRGPPAA